MNSIDERLIISIFCARDRWPILFNKCLEPLFEQNVKTLGMYNMSFAYNQGEHIEIEFFSKSTYSDIKLELEKSLSTFFKQNPQPVAHNHEDADQLFMNFLPGRFYFNLFPEISNSTHEQFKITLKYIITKQGIAKFKMAEVDDDSIFIFAIYLQHAMIKAFCNNSQAAWLHLGNIANMHMAKLKAEEQNQTQKSAAMIIMRNKNDLIDMVQNVWQPNMHQQKLKWLHVFIDDMIALLKTQKQQEELILFAFVQLFDQLGLNHPKWLVLSCMINHNLIILNKKE
jgi:hypothetical protein